jgi:hypothetical protein
MKQTVATAINSIKQQPREKSARKKYAMPYQKPTPLVSHVSVVTEPLPFEITFISNDVLSSDTYRAAAKRLMTKVVEEVFQYPEFVRSFAMTPLGADIHRRTIGYKVEWCSLQTGTEMTEDMRKKRDWQRECYQSLLDQMRG